MADNLILLSVIKHCDNLSRQSPAMCMNISNIWKKEILIVQKGQYIYSTLYVSEVIENMHKDKTNIKVFI